MKSSRLHVPEYEIMDGGHKHDVKQAPQEGKKDAETITITSGGVTYVGTIIGLFGCMKYCNGDYYEGPWVDDKRHGDHGKLEYYYSQKESPKSLPSRDNSDGDEGGQQQEEQQPLAIYEGSFSNDQKHGTGKLTKRNGDVYERGYVNDHKEGKGKFVTKNQSEVYEGDLKKGNRHGSGTLIDSKRDEHVGDFRVNTGILYQGTWLADKLHRSGFCKVENREDMGMKVKKKKLIKRLFSKEVVKQEEKGGSHCTSPTLASNTSEMQRVQRSTRTAVSILQLHEMTKVNFFASGEFHLQPLCDPTSSVIVSMDSVQEVDMDGNLSEVKTFEDRGFTYFDKEVKKLLTTGADDNYDDGARGDSVSFSTDLDNGCKVNVDAALVTKMGRVGSATHGWQGFPGDFKFGIELSNWMWKESGAFLDMQMEIAPTGGKVLPTISNKTYMLGNDECLLELTNEYFEIDQFSNKKQMFMPPGFPKMISRDNGKQVLAFRFSKFENKVFYDPLIRCVGRRSGIFNVQRAGDKSNVDSVTFGSGYDFTIYDDFCNVISKATSDPELSAGNWHKCEVVGGGGHLWLKRGQNKKYKIWQVLRLIDPYRKRHYIKVILHCRKRKIPVPDETPPGLIDDDFPFDVFLSHDWGRYEDGRFINHERVGYIDQALKERGFRTWFDGDQMQGDMHHRMAHGIEQSLTVIVFVTRNYLDKVNTISNDNCKFEFQHALNHRTVDNMIPVVMEDDVDSPWGGPVGLALGNHLYYSFKTDDELDECVDNLVTQIKRRRQQT